MSGRKPDDYWSDFDPLPRHVANSLCDDRLSGRGRVVLNAELDAGALAGSLVATCGAAMLAYAHDHRGGIPLTDAHTLGPEFLSWAVETFDWPGYRTVKMWAGPGGLTEADFAPGQFLRETLWHRGYLRRHRNSLRIRPTGLEVLDHPGLLHQSLFVEAFKGRKYKDSMDAFRWGNFYYGFGLELWRVRRAATEWISSRDLYEAVMDSWIVPIGDPMPPLAERLRCLHQVFMKFLIWFGLIECQVDDLRSFETGRYRYRITPLYDRFISFDVGARKRRTQR